MHDGWFYVYITTNPGKTALYTGVTNDLRQRIREHYEERGKKKTFAGRYHCYKLIYWEVYPTAEEAIHREKEIKAMSRKKKEELIATMNPNWDFLVP